MEDLASFDEDLADYLYKQPAEHLQLVRMEEASNLAHRYYIVRASLTIYCNTAVIA